MYIQIQKNKKDIPTPHPKIAHFLYQNRVLSMDFVWLIGIAALFIALATLSFQAIRAATANPVNSLLSE